MASPEQPSPPIQTDLIAALAATARKLERANEIENQIERFFKLEELLERYDELQAEYDEFIFQSKHF